MRVRVSPRAPVLNFQEFCRPEPQAGTALISRFVQSRFKFGYIIAPRFDFQEFNQEVNDQQTN